MKFHPDRSIACVLATFFCLLAGFVAAPACAQTSKGGSSSQSSSSSGVFAQEKTPSLIDPAGPTISLISLEPVFVMAVGLNACGYDEGLETSAPVRKRVRDEVDQALAKSEDARAKRDALCLYIAQHRMTGTERDDATQVVEVVPALKAFAAAVDLHGIWLTVHMTYDQEAAKVHDSLSQMIVSTNLYLKMPASTYDGRRFVVVIEPMLSPGTVNARIYGTDYVVVVSPMNGQIRMSDVRHTYLHYVIDPLLYARSNAIDREEPILKEIRESPLDFRYRSDTVPLTIECLIKAIEARTMDTGVPIYKIPTTVDRSDLPRYEHERQVTLEKAEAVRVALVRHDMNQGFVLTQYFFEQMIQFEKDPASLKDTIGEMVYSMDMDQQVHRARQIEFDKETDEDVLQRSKPRKLEGLDLAEARLSAGDVATAGAMAKKVLAEQADTVQWTAEAARAHFILARVDLMTGHPDEAIDDFQKTLATSKEQRLLAWSHIYLGRMLDLECKRDEALAEYKEGLADDDADDVAPVAGPAKAAPGGDGTQKPQ